MLIRLGLAALLLAAWLGASHAAPSRIIILRHGEKADDWKLCDTGQQRANALASNYLGRGAAKSLFATGEEPAFFFAITLHTLELASPAVASWNKPIILYSVVPATGVDDDALTRALNRRTQEAARNIIANPALEGKTVVMVWEHHHIADAALEAKFPDQAVTLRQLLKLDILPGVPATWPDETYDYFWIVEFDANSNVPARFSMVKQEFGAPYGSVSANDWDAPNGLDDASGCEVKGD
jgi:hypothetical protein